MTHLPLLSISETAFIANGNVYAIWTALGVVPDAGTYTRVRPTAKVQFLDFFRPYLLPSMWLMLLSGFLGLSVFAAPWDAADTYRF
jgi:hypothetical protein